MRISRIEKWTAIILLGLLWTALALLAGGPIFSDEMLYLDAGLRNMAVPEYGNRYFHIYLQKLFISIFPTPLTGVRVFWALLISLTTGLVYLNARIFTRKSTIFHGLLAIVFLFSFPRNGPPRENLRGPSAPQSMARRSTGRGLTAARGAARLRPERDTRRTPPCGGTCGGQTGRFRQWFWGSGNHLRGDPFPPV